MEADTIKREADVGNLDAVIGFIEDCAERCALETKMKFGLLIAVEEAFVNVCHYAYPGGGGDVELSCLCDGDAFVVEMTDSGMPFDILSLPDPDTTSDIQEREIGGLGVHFIRKLTDEVSYRREEGRNILRLVLRSGKFDGA